MRHKFTGFIVLVLGLSVQTHGQQPTPRQTVRLVALGSISRVDKTKRTFELTSQKDNDSPSDVATSGASIGVTIGTTAPPNTIGTSAPPNSDRRRLPTDPTGTGRRRNGPFSDPSDVFDEPPPKPPAAVSRTTVFLSESTVCKERDKVIVCDELRVTDSVRVTGDERREARGKGLYASEVVRTPVK